MDFTLTWGSCMLAEVPMFRGIPAEALERLEREARRRVFPAGGELMRQGDPSDSMHLIVSGRVEVRRSHPDLIEPLVFATLRRGDVVGEIGVLDGGPRTATVVATETTRTIELSAQQVAALILRYPHAARTLLRTVSQRLRTTNELAERLAREAAAKPRTPGDVDQQGSRPADS